MTKCILRFLRSTLRSPRADGVSASSRHRRREAPNAAAIESLETRTLLSAFTVTSLADFDPTQPVVADGEVTLREAIMAAASGQTVGDAVVEDEVAAADVIDFAVQGTIELTGGELEISSVGTGSLTILGEGITIDGQNRSRVASVEVGSSVQLRSLTLVDGDAAGVFDLSGDGGGLLVVDGRGDGALTLNDVTIEASDAINGGAIANQGALVQIYGGRLANNAADGQFGTGGAIASSGGTIVLGDVEVVGNVANRSGGGVEIDGGVLFVAQGSISDNLAGPDGAASPGNGGGIHAVGVSTVTLTAAMIQDNTAAADGGGLWFGSDTVATLRDATLIVGNAALGDEAGQGGGGIYNDGGRLTVRDVELRANVAAGDNGSGGGLLHTGSLIGLTRATIVENTASVSGGGIEVASGGLYLIDSDLGLADVPAADDLPAVFNGNRAVVGAGLHQTDGIVVLDDSRVTNNAAGQQGGGVWTGEAARLVARNNVILSQNSAGTDSPHPLLTDSSIGGGGLYNDGGRVDFFTGRFLANTATTNSGSGGGLLAADGTVVLANVTLDDNAATRAGGGIEVVDGVVYIVRSSLGGGVNGQGNRATGEDGGPGSGGGLHITGTASVVLEGGTVRNNTAAADGGGLWNAADSQLVLRSDVQVTDNASLGTTTDAVGGGGLYNDGGRLVLFGGRVANNLASGPGGRGGGIYSAGGRLEVAETTIARNTATASGGGVEVAGGLAYFASAVVGGVTAAEGNRVTAGDGGGLHTGRSVGLTVDGGSVRFNRASGDGGGLWNSVNSSLVVRNAAFVGDNVSGGAGGGIYNAGGLIVRGSSVIGNAAEPDGDGVLDETIDAPNDPADQPLAGGGVLTAAGAVSQLTDTSLLDNVIGDDERLNQTAGPGQTFLTNS